MPKVPFFLRFCTLPLKFSKNKHFLHSHLRVRIRGREMFHFCGKLGVLCFLETPIARFALLRYWRRFVHELINSFAIFLVVPWKLHESLTKAGTPYEIYLRIHRIKLGSIIHQVSKNTCSHEGKYWYWYDNYITCLRLYTAFVNLS